MGAQQEAFHLSSQWEKPGVGGKKEAPQTGISLGAVNLGLLEGRPESVSCPETGQERN